MENGWSEKKATEFITAYAGETGEDLALRLYASRLIGVEKGLVLHGGGNTSVKSSYTNVLGVDVPAIFIKASGHDLADIEPQGHPALDLGRLERLKQLETLSDDAMVNELRTSLFDAQSPTPSIEALLHVFIPAKYVDHTHADAILGLTNQVGGATVVREALGENLIVLDYVKPGFELAKTAAAAYEASPQAEGMVLLKHGLVTWGETARESYEKTIDLVTRAEKYVSANTGKPITAKRVTDPSKARDRYLNIASAVRGALAVPTGNTDWPYDRVILRPLITDQSLALVDSERGKEIALTPPLTADHLIRTKPLPLWIDDPQFDNYHALKEKISTAIQDYAREYDTYFERHSDRLQPGVERFDPMPRVVFLPGLGVVCAGRDVEEAGVVRDIASQTIATKMKIAAMGDYEGLAENHIFDMEYFGLQHAKLMRGEGNLLRSAVALVTGAAGAIGAGICEALLEEGCHVAVSDLHGDALMSLAAELKQTYGERVFAVALDVTDPDSVTQGFDRVIQGWGGVDVVVANAGAAHVSSLASMVPEEFRKLEKVNVEGTLNILSEAGRRFKNQGTGGDVVLLSTKNVFAPGAKFGAYSATKAAAHQLARIASLELAEIGVRVNMVSPDAVFSHGTRKSGLWKEVGPDRMRARGLDEKGLEDYYRDRNLLKARVTATHVAKAVLFFVTRQTPTTGATLPVDGGLPDATPR
ncbi:MAG: bifunctional aldolase/short-chain dehydrogenase [Candidatus Latescibacterota bacterium]|nr:MAG: bifunctional aldolase/short-chain dehydrogenase [Candidatus Latescibacterota bacterium]